MIELDAPIARRARLRNYISRETANYQLLAEEFPKARKYPERIVPWMRRTRAAFNQIDNRGYPIPRSFLECYKTPKQEFLPDDIRAGRGKVTTKPEDLMLKYQLRGYNLLREYLRYIMLIPEVLEPSKRFDLLELSAGSAASEELARVFNNSYQAADYMAERGSAYRPLHEEMGIDVIDFDGAQRPYRFDSDSYDVVICFQAIDAYGPVEDYPKFVTEMARIARRRVVLIFNPQSKGEQLDFEGHVFPVLKTAFPSGETGITMFPNLPSFRLDTGGF